MSEQILNSLLNFITKDFMVEKEDIDLEKSMIDEGIIDSFGLVEIATFIENEYHFTITEDKMTKDNFGSVNKLVNFIKKESA